MDQPTEAQMHYADFERDGEVEVRRQVDAGEWSGKALTYALRWLSHFDEAKAEAREDRRDSFSADSLAEARKANELATQANATARSANIIATIAMISAVLAIAVSIISIFTS